MHTRTGGPQNRGVCVCMFQEIPSPMDTEIHRSWSPQGQGCDASITHVSATLDLWEATLGPQPTSQASLPVRKPPGHDQKALLVCVCDFQWCLRSVSEVCLRLEVSRSYPWASGHLPDTTVSGFWSHARGPLWHWHGIHGWCNLRIPRVESCRYHTKWVHMDLSILGAGERDSQNRIWPITSFKVETMNAFKFTIQKKKLLLTEIFQQRSVYTRWIHILQNQLFLFVNLFFRQNANGPSYSDGEQFFCEIWKSRYIVMYNYNIWPWSSSESKCKYILKN